MQKPLYDYDIYPKVVLAGKGTDIHIRPMSPALAFTQDQDYEIEILPTTESLEGTGKAYPRVCVHPKDGVLSFFWAFEGEQEHFIRLHRTDRDRPFLCECQLSVYSVKQDLFTRRPYRGDFHVHTTCSDGREAPSFVAAMYRQKGFDFMAVTDHGLWEPSQEAMDAYAQTAIDLRLFHGEEVHAPGNPVHIINFGGSFSVNELFRQDEAGYYEAVRAIERQLPPLGEGISRFEYASCLWCVDQVRRGGGMAIFCHPHWLANVYHVPDAMTRVLLRAGIFDAFELVSGQSLRENMMQYALYGDLRAEGVQIPIVGSSDSHGVIDGKEFNHMKTLVFSPSLEREDINRSVMEGYSVPMDEYPGEQPRMQGSYRMVSYARFLLAHYFPYHDELCYEEGRLMRAYQAGERTAAEALERLSGRTRRLMEHYFA
jgi:hypothetical protein